MISVAQSTRKTKEDYGVLLNWLNENYNSAWLSGKSIERSTTAISRTEIEGVESDRPAFLLSSKNLATFLADEEGSIF